jgi:O-antigen/teichoic acid export membrane protein
MLQPKSALLRAEPNAAAGDGQTLPGDDRRDETRPRDEPLSFLAGSGAYLTARYGLGVLVSLGNMLVLTWWIGPHAYGLFVTAIGLVAFLSSLGRVGVDTYLVRREAVPDRRLYDIAGTVVLMASVALALSGAAVVPWLIRWYGNREFVAPYLVLLLSVPVIGLAGIPTAKLERDLDFRCVAGIEVAGQSLGLAVAMVLAWSGFGVWAAVAGQTVWQGFLLLAAYAYSGLVPRLRFGVSEAREMLSYGIGITASLRTWQLRTLVNPLLVGRFAGAEGVAFVGLAIRIAESLGAVRLAAGRLAIAILARVQHKRDDFRRTLEQALYLQVIVLGPLLCGFALFGSLIVRHIIGARWMPSLVVFPFVAAGVLVNSVYNLQASALFVTGRQWLVMRSYVTHVVILGAGTLFLLPRLGIAGYGWAELAACAGYLLIHTGLSGVQAISYRKLAPWFVIFLAILFTPMSSPHGVVLLWLVLPVGAAAWKSTQAPAGRRLGEICRSTANKVRLPAGTSLILCLALLTPVQVQPVGSSAQVDVTNAGTETIPATLFGMHFRLDKVSWPTVPFGSLRLWDTDTRWQNMNPRPGTYQFVMLDRYLSAARLHGLRDVLLSLSSTPDWASANPTDKTCDYARTALGDCGPPSDLNSDGSGADQVWRDFIYALGVHLLRLNGNSYATVNTFAMWNEFTRGSSSGRSSWLGSNQQLLRMTQDANCILTGRGSITATHQACTAVNMREPAVGLLPAAKIATPDAVPQLPGLAQYGAYLAQSGALDAIDVLAVHAYAYRGLGKTSPDAGSAGLPSQSANIARVLSATTTRMPVWSTEGSWGDTSLNLPDPDMQMGYVARYYLGGWSTGFRRLYWYAADNSWGRLIYQNRIGGCNDHGTGRGCPTMAATAWTQVYKWMVGNRMTSKCTPDAAEQVWSCGLVTPGGKKLLAVWDASQTCANGLCTTRSYTYPAEYKQYFTLASGRSKPLNGGTVQIGWKPILLSQAPME